MALRSSTPSVYIAFSFLAFSGTLQVHTPKHQLACLVVFFTFAILSFGSAQNLLWVAPRIAVLWAQSIVLNILHVVSLLYIERIPLSLRSHSHTKSTGETLSRTSLRYYLRSAYKIWGNPQLHNVARSTTQKPSSASEKKVRPESYIFFLITRLIKLSVYYFLHQQLIPLCISLGFGNLNVEDFAPAQSHLFPDIRTSTPRQMGVRTYVSLSWIYESFLLYDAANCILATCFVSVGLDEPSEWPALFGNPAAATSLRQFWGRFWHKVGVRTYSNYGKLVASSLKLPAKSTGSKTIIAFSVFLVSGVSHSLVSYNFGDSSWQLDTYWFLLNFVVCAFETYLTYILKAGATAFGWSRILEAAEESWMSNILGYTWVLLFFWCSVPMWKYPRLHTEALVRAQNERWMRILQTATIIEN